jgi:peptidoglycan lytic transglycosylase G
MSDYTSDKTGRSRSGGGAWEQNSGWRGRRGRELRRWLIRLVVVAAFLGFVAGTAHLVNRASDWYHDHSTTSTLHVVSTVTKVTIASGMTAAEIGQLLEEEGVIESAVDFVDLVKSRGTENGLLPGKYSFSGDLQLLQVVDMLEKGEGSETFKITIPEGRSSSQIAADLTKDGHISGTDYADLCAQPTGFELPQIGGEDAPELTTLEGLLFPSTYWLVEGDAATQLIGAQLAAFGTKTASLPWEKAETLGMTPYEVVIVASLIEKEVSVPAERELVAAVIYNRLEQGMTLGIDATVRYALDKWTGDLTDEDLEVDSPYNTRVVEGLPPTPIANPGLAALQAALEPAGVDYLYYVLEDTEGNHFFTADYDEFLEAKENQPEQ